MSHGEPSGAARGQGDLTRLLLSWQSGDREALGILIAKVYPELRRLALRQLRREKAGHTLQPTAVVHEAFLRLIDQSRVDWQCRAHFFAIAAQSMRRVLIDYARSRLAKKRRHDEAPLSLSAVRSPDDGLSPVDLLALDTALGRLENLDPEQARIVELRFFAGLTVEETAVAMDLSPATIKRHWRSARAWLYQ